jgi:hypothetical protein
MNRTSILLTLLSAVARHRVFHLSQNTRVIHARRPLKAVGFDCREL